MVEKISFGYNHGYKVDKKKENETQFNIFKNNYLFKVKHAGFILKTEEKSMIFIE